MYKEKYTVKELIEALRECPENYEVQIIVQARAYHIVSVGIDEEEKTVDLFEY